jgi:hypothetical protein
MQLVAASVTTKPPCAIKYSKQYIVQELTPTLGVLHCNFQNIKQISYKLLSNLFNHLLIRQFIKLKQIYITLK